MKKTIIISFTFLFLMASIPIALSHLSFEGHDAIEKVSNEIYEIERDDSKSLELYSKYIMVKGDKKRFSPTIEGFAAYSELRSIAIKGNALALTLFIKASKSKIISDIINENNVMSNGHKALNTNIVDIKEKIELEIMQVTKYFMKRDMYLQKYKLFKMVKKEPVISYYWDNELLISVFMPFFNVKESEIIFNNMNKLVYSKYLILSREWIVASIKENGYKK